MLYDVGSQSLKICKITDLTNLGRKPLVERVYTGISFPRPLLEVMDAMRGDVTRTRFVQRILEKHIMEQKEVVEGQEVITNGVMGSTTVTSQVSTNTTPTPTTSTEVVARKTSSLLFNNWRSSA